MQSSAWHRVLRYGHVRCAHTAPAPAPRVPSPIPPDVPLAWLSTRSLINYCMGMGEWRQHAHSPRASSLHDLPPLHTDRGALAEVERVLRARQIPPPRFVAWFNVCTSREWSECAALLEREPIGTIPPFVLQRALHKITSIADAASAVRLVHRHLDMYTVMEAHRLCHVLLTTCLHKHRAWHVAKPLTACVLQTVRRWLTKDYDHRPHYAKALLERAWHGWWLGMPDKRASLAMDQIWDAVHELLPSAVDALESFVCEQTKKRSGAEKVQPDQVQHWVETCARRDAFLALGVRVATLHNNTDMARAMYNDLPGHHSATTPFLRALATSPTSVDVDAAWTLFDAMTRGDDAPVATVDDWKVMLRAAASDPRIPPHRVTSLLGLDEGRGKAPWHVPLDVQNKLARSVGSHTALVEGLLQRGDVARAWAVWDAMAYRGIVPDVWALKTLCTIYFAAGLPARALECVLQWCERGVRLTRRAGPIRLQVPTDLSGAHMRVESHGRPYRHVRIRPTTHLANALLVGLYRARAYETLLFVWHALGPTLHVCPDVASLDLMLRASAALARTHGHDASAARAYFLRIVAHQHPELQACTNPLESPGMRGWIVRGELQLRRWERWMEQRVRAMWRTPSPPVPAAPLPSVTLDARIFHHYCELLMTLMEVDVSAAPRTDADEAWEELFLVAAWMRALDVAPLRETLCLWCAAHDERVPPAASSAAWRAWLAQWVGPANVPDDGEAGAWYRAHRARSTAS